MLAYNEIKTGKIIIYEDEPHQVMDYHVARTQQRKPQNQVKLKSLISGKTFATTFHVSDKAEEAEMIKKEAKFLYNSKNEYWFCDPTDPKNRFQLDEKILGDTTKFLKTNENITTLIFDRGEPARNASHSDAGGEKIIGIKLPIKMTFVVKDAPPSIKGSTATGSGKIITLENGTSITVPMFIETGEKIVVNTETGEYTERA